MTLFLQAPVRCWTHTGDDRNIAHCILARRISGTGTFFWEKCKRILATNRVLARLITMYLSCTLRSHLFIYKCKRLKKKYLRFFLFFHFIVLFLRVSLNGDAFIILVFLFLKRWYARYACPCMSERALIHYQREFRMCGSVWRSASSIWCYYFIYLHICFICNAKGGRESESRDLCRVLLFNILPVRLFLDRVFFCVRSVVRLFEKINDWNSRHKFNNNFSINVSYAIKFTSNYRHKGKGIVTMCSEVVRSELHGVSRRDVFDSLFFFRASQLFVIRRNSTQI